jgi:hypothetical protein
MKETPKRVVGYQPSAVSKKKPSAVSGRRSAVSKALLAFGMALNNTILLIADG